MIEAKINRLEVSAYTIPTETPEADGTLEWDSTSIVLAELEAAGTTGLGYTYTEPAAAGIIRRLLEPVIYGGNAMDVSLLWERMLKAVRNIGRPGLASMAIAAVDTALWDLKARLLQIPLIQLFGSVRRAVPVYGSGGFTNYSLSELERQLVGWVDQGISVVKIKVGAHPDADIDRVAMSRRTIGDAAELMVDANGAYTERQALFFADAYAECGVSWFEEPVSSDDLEGLKLIRNRAPEGMHIAAGEYGYDIFYFRRMLEAGAVDVLMPDATRCAGFSGFMQAAVLANSHHIPLSAHTAPALHGHIGCAFTDVLHVELFHDHERIERLFFDGALEPIDGMIRLDVSRYGIGLMLKRNDVECYRVS